MKFYTTLLLILITMAAGAQGGKALTIDSCYVWAKQNYPLLKQHDVIQKTKDFTMQNAWRVYIPQLNVAGQVTYQSQTTQFSDAFGSISAVFPQFANIQFPKYSKDQYRFTAEVYQTIFDGGTSKYKKETAQAQADIQQQNLEVNLYTLNDRVNQVYFGALLIEEQLKLNKNQQDDLQNGIDRIQGLITNGAAFKSSADEIKAQLLTVKQNATELSSARKAYLLVLGLLINQPLDDNTQLTKPANPAFSVDIKRPELTLYDLQKKTYEIQARQLNTGLMPQANAFFDGSYGRPTLNTVSNDFGAFWLTGIRFNWSLTALYTRKNNKGIYRLNQNDLDIQKEAFLFNTKITLTQQEQEMKKYSELLETDKEIVDLRTSVKNASNAQLQNGVLTGHDYITQVDAEARARETMALHQIQLLQTQYNHSNTVGN